MSAPHCPMHDERSGYVYPPCFPNSCPFTRQAKLLEDRVDAIHFLVEGVRSSLLDGCDHVAVTDDGQMLSLSAALETARVLASVLLDDPDPEKNDHGKGRVRWVALHPAMMMERGPLPASGVEVAPSRAGEEDPTAPAS